MHHLIMKNSTGYIDVGDGYSITNIQKCYLSPYPCSKGTYHRKTHKYTKLGHHERLSRTGEVVFELLAVVSFK